jgi:MYXO-CTERM domain-containing protein
MERADAKRRDDGECHRGSRRIAPLVPVARSRTGHTHPRGLSSVVVARPLPWSCPSLLAVTAVLVGAAVPSRTAAHGGRPQTQAVLFDPGDPDRILVPATFGLLGSDVGGARWTWICQEAIPDAVPGIVLPGVLTPDGGILFAGTYGVVRGTDHGCAWERVASLADRYIADLQRAPGVGSPVLAITGDSDRDNFLFESTDGGASFASIGAPLPTGVVIERLRIAPSDTDRLYASGQVRTAGSTAATGVVARSDDRGASWTTNELALDEGERLVRIQTVDPSRPDVAWLVVQGNEHDRVLRTEDGARTWIEVIQLNADPMPYFRPFALAIASDGTVWLGNPREGLFAVRPGEPPELIDKFLGVACAVAQGDRVWLCADGLEDEYALATIEGAPDAYAPVPVIRFGMIEQHVCGTGVDCECGGWWDDFRRETEPDAGVSPADAATCPSDGGAAPQDAGDAATGGLDGGMREVPVAPGGGGGCSCRVDPARAREGSVALFLAALAGIGLWRRARARAR